MAGHFWAICGTSTHIYSPMFHSLKNEIIQQWDNSNFIYYIVYSDNIRTILYFVPLQMDFIPETNWDRDLNAPGAQGSRGTCSEHGSAGPSRSDFAKSLGLGDTTWLFCSNEKGRWLRNKQEKGDILTSWLGVFFCVFCLTWPILEQKWHPEASLAGMPPRRYLSVPWQANKTFLGKDDWKTIFETKKQKGLNRIHRLW